MRSLAGKLRRIWPRRLTGQLIALLLLALILAQAATFLIFVDERRAAIRSAERKQILERTASIVRLIESTPPALHEQIAATASSRYLRFWLADSSALPARASDVSEELRRRLELLLEDDRRELVVVVRDEGETEDGSAHSPAPDAIGAAGQLRPAHAAAPLAGAAVPIDAWLERYPPELLISARLADDSWLNVGMNLRPPTPPWARPSLWSMALTALALSAIVIVMVRRIARPMARLATAAEQMGLGAVSEPLAEQGPLEVRQTTRAFNRMHERLARFVQDRTRMLAAISHDLRTPITSLRLRAEFVDDEETRAKILETLDEMQRMTEATLAFAREDAAREETRVVDLAALVESLCEDLADMGKEVAFAGASKTPYACRPTGLKRALRNLIENAVIYGARARVSLARRGEEFRIEIEDDGPGIPEADFERAFAPFVRLEESRNKDTGGIGLGMAIARSIARGHGGDIVLANPPRGGLRVTVRLPEADHA